MPISQRVKPMKRSKVLNVWFQSSLLLGVILMSACSSSKHAKEGDAASQQAQSDSGKAPTDSVPGASGEVEDNVELVLAREAASGQGSTASATESSGAPDSASQSGSGATGSSASGSNTSGPSPASVASSDASGDSSASSSPVASSSGSHEDTSASSAADSGGGEKYKVKAGDTLMRISWEQYGTLFRWREIYNANKGVVQDPNHIPPGTVLNLSTSGRSPASAMEHNGDQYLIKSGDTLGTISGKVYGTTEKWKKLWENNKQLIRNPNKIYAGFYLYYVPETKKVTSVDEKEADAGDSGTG